MVDTIIGRSTQVNQSSTLKKTALLIAVTVLHGQREALYIAFLKLLRYSCFSSFLFLLTKANEFCALLP